MPDRTDEVLVCMSELPPGVGHWVVFTVNQPTALLFRNESWKLDPPLRYIACSDQLTELHKLGRIASWSKLDGGQRKLKPLYQPTLESLKNRKLLVERHRNRGLGDLLFVSGILNWLWELSGRTLQIYLYGLGDRSSILDGAAYLANNSPLAGPVMYDSLDSYDYHWFIDHVTEYSEEKDQELVYHALLRQLGVDPEKVDPKYFEPAIHFSLSDYDNWFAFVQMVKQDRGIDLSATPYVTVAPLCASSLRSMPYQVWLGLIEELASKVPVVLLGVAAGQVPAAGMPFSSFNSAVVELGNSHKHVINLVGEPPIKLTAMVIKHSRMYVGLDSGPLYVAQGVGTPSVSFWGTHDPKWRLRGSHLQGALARTTACPHSPCGSFFGFPQDKCPRGSQQTLCQPLAELTVPIIVQHINGLVKSGYVKL